MVCTPINLGTKHQLVQAIYIPCTTLFRSGFSGVELTTPEQLMAALQANYGLLERDFEIITTISPELFLRLPCDRSNYQPNLIFPSGEPAYNRSFFRRSFRMKSYQLELEITITDQRSGLFYAVEEISESTTGADLASKTEITIIDAVLPSGRDMRTFRASDANPYTLRKGVIKLVVPKSGTIGRGGDRYMVGGFSFKFEDSELRVQ
jgi:hypothetical protein